MFINNAWAQAAADTAGSANPGLAFLFQIVLFILILYFIIFRPNQKRYKAHQEMLMAIKPGDKIITGGGFYAKVVKCEGEYDLLVELEPSHTQVLLNRLTVRDVVSDETADKANDNKKSKKK